VVKVKKADSQALAQGVIRMFHNDFEIIEPKLFSWEKALPEYESVIRSLVN